MMKRLAFIMKHTGMTRMLIVYAIFFSIVSIILFIIEPNIKNVGDGFWFTFVASSTIGFGDITAASAAGRVLTVIVSIYGIILAAMIPGVLVSYYNEYLKFREKETVTAFLEKLEHLPELSKEELTELSDKVKRFTKNM